MTAFYLYRLKAIRSKQSTFFESNSRRDFISELISRKPSSEIREGYVWHVGNILPVGNDGLLFAVGRTTKSSKEKYDENSGDFLQIDDEEAPFTYVLYDLVHSVIAISPKAKLSPTVKGIARSIEKLFNEQPYTLDNEVRIEVAEISDPEGFIDQIHSAFAVVGFTVDFGEPNPFDVDKDFHEPMEKYLQAAGGEKGKTNIQGADLNRDTLEELTRSVASTGNEATARIRKKRGSKAITKHMKGDPVSVSIDDMDIPEMAKKLLLKIKEAYQRLRKHDE